MVEARSIADAAAAIQRATSLLIGAGAGIGVDSGLPDFRGNNGFWKAYPALHGYPFSAMANPDWFTKDPSRAWGFYGHRLNLYRETTPHNGFNILRNLAVNKNTFVYTSNVDGQFQKAGFSAEQICECHGSIHWLQHLFPSTSGTEIWSANHTEVNVDTSQVRAVGDLPSRNGQLVRPNILMFGDYYWLAERTDQQYDNMQKWYQQVEPSKLVIIEIGAGTAVPSVRNRSQFFQQAGATLVRINPREPQGADIQLACGAKEALEAIEKILTQ